MNHIPLECDYRMEGRKRFLAFKKCREKKKKKGIKKNRKKGKDTEKKLEGKEVLWLYLLLEVEGQKLNFFII